MFIKVIISITFFFICLSVDLSTLKKNDQSKGSIAQIQTNNSLSYSFFLLKQLSSQIDPQGVFEALHQMVDDIYSQKKIEDQIDKEIQNIHGNIQLTYNKMIKENEQDIIKLQQKLDATKDEKKLNQDQLDQKNNLIKQKENELKIMTRNNDKDNQDGLDSIQLIEKIISQIMDIKTLLNRDSKEIYVVMKKIVIINNLLSDHLQFLPSHILISKENSLISSNQDDYQNPVYVNKTLKQYEKIEQMLLQERTKKIDYEEQKNKELKSKLQEYERDINSNQKLIEEFTIKIQDLSYTQEIYQENLMRRKKDLQNIIDSLQNEEQFQKVQSQFNKARQIDIQQELNETRLCMKFWSFNGQEQDLNQLLYDESEDENNEEYEDDSDDNNDILILVNNDNP